MSNKIILTQICKDEEHVITRMLDSAKPVIDIICLVDTGSSDNTIEVVKKWGEENGIEAHVFERLFDNFENSRNYSIEKAQEIADNKIKNGDSSQFYGIWLDCDEQLIISKDFDKESLDKDLYMITTHIGNMRYTRNELFKLNNKFKFYGPVHEYIIPVEKNITSGLVKGLEVDVKMDGGSWQQDVSQKYKRHADMLEEYLVQDRNPRWVFYTGQSWHDSATTKSRSENDERLRRSLNYYQERVTINDGYPEERFYSQLRVGIIKKMLELPWKEVQMELLKAYSIDPMRGESIKIIIEHYQKSGDWNLAHLYSTFAYSKFHKNSPYPDRLLFVDESFYQWKALELHMNSTFYLKDIETAKRLAQELIKIIGNDPHKIPPQEQQRIKNNVSQIMSLK